MNKGTIAAVAGLGLVLLATGILLGCYGFPALVHEQIKNSVTLRNGTDAFARWLKLPQPLSFKVYLFNVTNWEAATSGARPILKEVGPYYYDEYRENTNVVDHPDDESMTYEQKSTFIFNKEKSEGRDENDLVTVLNLALLGTALKVQAILPFALPMMNPVMAEIFPDSHTPFVTTSVRNFLFDGVVVIDCVNTNHSDTAEMVCTQAADHLPRTVRQDQPGIFKFAMFHYKNGTEGWFRVKRGLTNTSDVGHLTAWNNKTNVHKWGEKHCDEINGTDSTIFPPFLSRTQPLYIFATDLCRSVHAVYDKDVEAFGIPAYRYVAYDKLLASGNTEPANRCFCPREGCLEDGVIDLSKCHDAPVVASFPHFYLASEKYKNYAIGLNPQKELHETYLDIETKAGAPLRGAKRIQMNMFMTRIPALDPLKSVTEGLFPVLWVEEGALLEGDSLALVQSAYKKLTTLDAVKWVIVGVSCAVLAVAAFLYCNGSGDGGDPTATKSSCCGRRQSNRITSVAPNHHVTISTIDGLLRRDGSIPVQTFPAAGDAGFKRGHGEVFN